jgi:seryl-tRNA synthetase
VLSPAACYPVYPIAAARGRLPSGGLLFDIEADVFRHEPSSSLDRLQSFRMREFVRIGAPDEIVEFREKWMAKAPLLAAELGLPHTMGVANDPFFGRVGQVMAVSQRQQALKFELLIPYYSNASPTACMSFNYHREHFGQAWGIRDEKGELAHTSCVAFGIDRLAVALFANHGLDLKKWPAATRQALAL